MPIKKEKIEKKTVKAKKPAAAIPNKQYSICHMMGNEERFFVTNGTDYGLAVLSIKAQMTPEIFSCPVVVIFDTEADTKDIIPMSSVVNIRQNWGVRADVERKLTEIAKKEPSDPQYV